MKFKASYTYDHPASTGPFKGSMDVDRRYKRGETIWAMFGRATVKSCRAAPLAAQPSHENSHESSL